MKKVLLSLMLVTPLVCKMIESNNRSIWRCENNEVVCYMFDAYRSGGGISCKFKEQSDDKNRES